jgi:hypothetical protein
LVVLHIGTYIFVFKNSIYALAAKTGGYIMSDFVDAIILSYEKPVVLNAIYDVIDALGLVVEHINSERGILFIRTLVSIEIFVRILP